MKESFSTIPRYSIMINIALRNLEAIICMP